MNTTQHTGIVINPTLYKIYVYICVFINAKNLEKIKKCNIHIVA